MPAIVAASGGDLGRFDCHECQELHRDLQEVDPNKSNYRQADAYHHPAMCFLMGISSYCTTSVTTLVFCTLPLVPVTVMV